MQAPVTPLEGLLLWLIAVDCTMHYPRYLPRISYTVNCWPTFIFSQIYVGDIALICVGCIADWQIGLSIAMQQGHGCFLSFLFSRHNSLHLGYLFKSIWFDLFWLGKFNLSSTSFFPSFFLVYFYKIYGRIILFRLFFWYVWQKENIIIYLESLFFRKQLILADNLMNKNYIFFKETKWQNYCLID